MSNELFTYLIDNYGFVSCTECSQLLFQASSADSILSALRMSLAILVGDASVPNAGPMRRREVGVHSAVYIASGRERELISEQDAYWSLGREGLITPSSGELLWIVLALHQLAAYLEVMPGTVHTVHIFCDNAFVVDCVITGGDAAALVNAHHLETLAQLCHLRVQAMREQGCLVRVRRPHHGRRSSLIQTADARAREVRRARQPTLSAESDLHLALVDASNMLLALPQEDREGMLGRF